MNLSRSGRGGAGMTDTPNPDVETLIGEWERRRRGALEGYGDPVEFVEAGDRLVAALREAEKERERLEQEIDAMDSRRAFEWERAEAAEGDNRKLREALWFAKRLRAAVENCTDETPDWAVVKACDDFDAALAVPPPTSNHTFNPGSLTDEEAQALYWSLRAELRERGLSTTTHKWPLPKKEEQ